MTRDALLVATGVVGLVGSWGVVTAGGTEILTAVATDQVMSHWWVFPASVLFSGIALAAGVSGALFFSPFFIFVVGLTPAQAIGAGLLTEVFGMGNGLRSYVQQGAVDYGIAKWLLVAAIPAIGLGALLSHHVEPAFLKLVFGAGLVGLGLFLAVFDPEDRQTGEECTDGAGETDAGDRKTTTIETADGKRYTYETCRRSPGVVLSGIGAFITGLISAGLPEIITTHLVVRCRIPPRVAVATSVFTLAIAAVVGALIHALSATPVWYVVVWSVPGVLIGGTLGTQFGKYAPSDLMETALGGIFACVGVLVLAVELLV